VASQAVGSTSKALFGTVYTGSGLSDANTVATVQHEADFLFPTFLPHCSDRTVACGGKPEKPASPALMNRARVSERGRGRERKLTSCYSVATVLSDKPEPVKAVPNGD